MGTLRQALAVSRAASSPAHGRLPCLPGLVHVGDELREVNGVAVLHKRPDEISQILVGAMCCWGGDGSPRDPEQGSQSQAVSSLGLTVSTRKGLQARWSARWSW